MNAKPASGRSISIENRIRHIWDSLSAHEQRLADVILSAPGELAMQTATELASSAGVSKATTTRFFRHLGYESYEAARRQVRELQSSGSPLYVQHFEPADHGLGAMIQAHLEHEVANMANTYRSLDAAMMNEVIQRMARARRIVVMGWRHSQTIAAMMRRDLVHIHPDVQLLPVAGDSLSEYLAALGAEDFAICIGLRRRMPVLTQAMNCLAELNVPMLYLSDVLSGKPARQANWVIRCHTQGNMMFDSTASLSGICNLLCSLVARERGNRANDYLAKIEDLHQELDELE